jgi:hypothetical protein
LLSVFLAASLTDLLFHWVCFLQYSICRLCVFIPNPDTHIFLTQLLYFSFIVAVS